MTTQIAFLWVLCMGVLMAVFAPCQPSQDMYDHKGNRKDEDL